MTLDESMFLDAARSSQCQIAFDERPAFDGPNAAFTEVAEPVGLVRHLVHQLGVSNLERRHTGDYRGLKRSGIRKQTVTLRSSGVT